MPSQPLMVHGPYCPRIHHARRNTKPIGFTVRQKNCYALVGIHSGGAELAGGSGPRQLAAPAAALIPPRHPAVLHLPAGARWELVRFDVIHVPLRYVSGTTGATTHRDPRPQPSPEQVWGFVPPLVVEPRAVPACLDALRYIGSLWWRGEPGYVRANARLQWWLGDYLMGLAEGGAAAHREEDPWLRRVRELARHGLEAGITVAELARELGTSRVHLRRRLLAATGEAPKELLLRLRMTRATDLLNDPDRRDETVANLALLCGFRSPAAFTRAFARYHGTTPGRWRRGHSGIT